MTDRTFRKLGRICVPLLLISIAVIAYGVYQMTVAHLDIVAFVQQTQPSAVEIAIFALRQTIPGYALILVGGMGVAFVLAVATVAALFDHPKDEFD